MEGPANGAEPPTRIEPKRRVVCVRSASMTVLAGLAVLYTLYFARPILMPLAVALLLALVLMPIVRFFDRKLRLPPTLSAVLLIVVLVLGTAAGFYRLSGPAMRWIREMPHSFAQIEGRLQALRKPVEEIQRAAEEMQDAASMAADDTVELTVTEQSATRYLMEEAQWVILLVLLTMAFLFFMLASGDSFLLKLVKSIPRFEDKKHAVAVVHEIQEDIAAYALTITLINAGLGVATGLVVFALGVPNAVLWGVMAAVLNFIPYVGAIVGVVTIGLVAMVSFESVGYALLTPLAYATLTSLEANFVTPLILGRRLRLNPLVLFAAVIFWGWIWGVPGALIAVPITVAMRIVFDRFDRFRAAAEFFGR